MSAVTVSSQGEKAAPSPQARGINLLSTPRRRRQEQVPGGSGAARAGGRDSGEARRVSARESPRKRRRNGARRAAARPRASCVRLGLLRRRGRRGPFRSPGDDKSLLAMGTRGTERERREPRPSLDLEAPRTSPAPTARARRERGLDAPASPSAGGAPSGRALPAPTAPRSPLSGPPNGERSAIPLCPGSPRRPNNAAGALSSRGSSLPQAAGTQKPEDGRKGQRAGS